jgi:hypothetical protein
MTWNLVGAPELGAEAARNQPFHDVDMCLSIPYQSIAANRQEFCPCHTGEHLRAQHVQPESLPRFTHAGRHEMLGDGKWAG